MTEGNTVKTKRMGTRFFKNPPQPYMCIRDTLMGSADPCYVNVLSWEKVGFAGISSEDVPLYGGMKVCPPRSEKKEVSVFAVIAHPDVLRQHGKNTHNPMERTWLIDVLLDFVEKMNNGVVFNRRYTVLRDRDITGELKEIWMVVQSDRAKAQQATAGEELRRPVPQYSQYQEQQQQLQQQYPMRQPHQHSPQQHQQQQQQHQSSHQQSHQQQQQQQSIQHPHEEHAQQPPQYHSTVFYAPEGHEKSMDARYDYEARTRSRDRVYPSGQIPQQYTMNVPRNDQYLFRAPIVPSNSQIQQQNCLGYQPYQNHPMLRLMGSPGPTNFHLNPPLTCPTAHPTPPINLVRSEPPIRYNKFTTAKEILEMIHRKPPPLQQQQPPQTSHVQLGHPSSTGYYESQNSTSTNVVVLEIDESETSRRASSRATRTRPFLMPHTAAPLQQPHFATMNSSALNSSSLNTAASSSTPGEINTKKPSTINFLKLVRPQDADVSRKDIDQTTEIVTTGSCDGQNVEEMNSRETSSSLPATQEQQKHFVGNATRDQTSKKSEKPKIEESSKIKVLKRNKTLSDEKGPIWDSKIVTNGDGESSHERKIKDRSTGKDADVEDRLETSVPESERNGSVDDQRRDGIGVTKSATSMISTRSIVIFAGQVKETEEATSKKKSNGHPVVTTQGSKESNEEIMQVYTILRKPEATSSQDDVTSDIAQLSIKEMRPVWRRGERNEGIGDRRSGARRVGQAMRPR